MTILFGLIGGMGLFLYGLKVMADGLEKTTGERLKKLMEVLSNNRVMGVIVGTVVTGIIQSSSATTVMVVGFVNAGIINLTQAAGVIMGANIGTTVTAQIISFNLVTYAPLAVGVGVMFWMYTKNRKTKQWAEILIGFGILLLGIEAMSLAMEPMREFSGFMSVLGSFGSGALKDTAFGILAGFALTVVVQSSVASLGILIALAFQGLVPIEAAVPIIFGANIGTCVTALLSGIGANKTAKRAALLHLLFNVIGTLIFVFLLSKPVMEFVIRLNPGDVARQIANVHSLFNLINMFIQISFAGALVYLTTKLIPESVDEGVRVEGIKYLDDRILGTPAIAVGQCIKEVLHMGNIAGESYEKSMEAFFNADEALAHEVFRIERIINSMEKEIAGYLVKLSNTALSEEQHFVVNGLFGTSHDIERVGDHADNLAELALYRVENNMDFSDSAEGELRMFHERVLKSYKESLLALRTGDVHVAQRVIEREEEIDHVQKTLRASHIARMNRQQCSPASGVIFLDILTNLERIGDHASKIAFAVLDVKERA